MTSCPLAAGDRVRIRPVNTTTDIYGRVASTRDSTAAVECRDREGDPAELSAGAEAEVIAFGPTEIRMFAARILADKGSVVVVTIPTMARVVRNRGGYRKPCDIPVSCTLSDEPGESLDGRLEDISLGGLLLALDRTMDLGAQLVARFKLPGSTQEVEVAVEVVRIVPAERTVDNKPRIGCAFTSVGRTAIGRLTQFVEEALATKDEGSEHRAIAS